MSYTPRLQLTLAISVLSVGGVLPVAAQTIHEDLKVVASDSWEFDEFGYSVAVSGTTAIVGAWLDDDAGSDSGSAYLFDTETGQQLFKFTASDAAEQDRFGSSVAISGTRAIIGAFWDDDGGDSSGSAYVFDTITGQQLFKLTASDAAAWDSFGVSVAISGATAIVGADGNDDVGGGQFSDSGSAYIFDMTTGEQLFKLTASDAAAGDEFGQSVAISGSMAIIGAHWDDDTGSASGSAYLFDTETGQQLFKLTASDAASYDLFGVSVAISGTTAIVGALNNDDAGHNSGAAYLFDTVTGNQVAKLTASDAVGGEQFGFSVAILGTRAIVGAYQDGNGGKAYLFDTETRQQLFKLTASDAAAEDSFGVSVAISGTTAIVGALQDDDNGSNSGSAYLFTALSPCPADLNGDGELDFLDISDFIAAYASGEPLADLNNDGEYDFLDISAFLASYTAGCP